MEKDRKMGIKEIVRILELISKSVCAVGDYIRSKPYGIIHKTAPITYMGKKGLLVWDWVFWNELTFEDIDSHCKYSLANRISDKETESIFNELVAKYGD